MAAQVLVADKFRLTREELEAMAPTAEIDRHPYDWNHVLPPHWEVNFFAEEAEEVTRMADEFMAALRARGEPK